MSDIEENIFYKARKEYEKETNEKFSRRRVVDELLPKANSIINEDKLHRIENDKNYPTPDDVYELSKAYNKPELKSYYCNNCCVIGEHNGMEAIGDVDKSKLPQIVLELLSQLNSIQKDRLIDISADGDVDINEKTDFIAIRNQLDKISQTVQSLRIWAEKIIGE